MSKDTKIQWCDSTVNPTMGCEGCELWSKKRKSCYAGVLHTRFGGRTPGYAPSFEVVTRFPGRMAKAAAWKDLRGTRRAEKPWLDGLPRLIFVSDMSDALSSVVSFEYLDAEIIHTVVSLKGLDHRWLWLSKRPERMAKFSTWLAAKGTPWPANLWAGTSITGQVTTSRIDHLLEVGDSETIRFLSVEPQIEPLELGTYLPDLDWVLHGGESGTDAREFKIEWAEELMQQCKRLRVPYFLKQLGSVVTHAGKRVQFEDAHAGDWAEWPRKLAVRQFPKPR